MAGYAGNSKLKAYLGDVKVKGYLGNVKVFGGEAWEEAIELVGYSAASLDAVLASSEMCTALAGNAEAYGIMKNNYSSEMTAAIDSNFSDGLNLLNYKCKLKTYLFKNGNVCSNITGGFKWQNPDSTECAVVDNKLRLSKYSGDSHLWSNNKITMDGFSTLHWTAGTWRSGSTSWNRVGFDTSQSSSGGYPFTASTQSNTSSTGSKSVSVSSLTGQHYFKAVVYGTSYLSLDNVYLTP